jgi:uncharacterized damage-inducible protein DinB
MKRPQLNEYAPYADAYVSLVPVDDDILQLLTDNQQSSFELFYNLDDEKANSNYSYAPGKWTVKQLLGHMVDTERVFGFRAFCFSRENCALPGFEQDEYVNSTDYNSRTIQSLAQEFKIARESNLYVFRNLSEAQLLRTGIASGVKVTVRALVYLTAGHELYHLRLLREKYML